MVAKKPKYSLLQLMLIAAVIALIGYVPLKTIYNIAIKGSVRGNTEQQMSQSVSIGVPADIFSIGISVR